MSGATRILTTAVMAAGLSGLAGCGGQLNHLVWCDWEMAKIPNSALLVASTEGPTSYTVPKDGTVYVYDKTSDRIAYTGLLKAGQTILINTKANKVLVDGQPVVEGVSLGDGKKYEIFLQS